MDKQVKELLKDAAETNKLARAKIAEMDKQELPKELPELDPRAYRVVSKALDDKHDLDQEYYQAALKQLEEARKYDLRQHLDWLKWKIPSGEGCIHKGATLCFFSGGGGDFCHMVKDKLKVCFVKHPDCPKPPIERS